MRSSLRWMGRYAVGLLLLAAAGCHGEDSAPEASAMPFSAVALNLTSVRVRWTPMDDAGFYRLYRRENLTGPFNLLADNVNRSQGEYLDLAVRPDTRYGYRLEVIDRQGVSLGFTTVSGTATPPLPGITIKTQTQGPAASLDPDGYNARISSATDTAVVPVDAIGVRTVSPLRPGPYRVALEGLAANCLPVDSLTRDVTVTDQGLNTVQTVSYLVSCSDPSLGDLKIAIVTTGDVLPANYHLKVVGITDSLQAVVIEQTTASANSTELFPGLRPGSYQVLLQAVPDNCTVEGGATLDDVPVTAGSTTERTFRVTCTDPDAGNKPFILTSTFNPATSPAGSVVELLVQLDLRAEPDKRATTVQATIAFDQAVVQYDSALAGQLNTIFVVGTATPGQVIPGGVKAGLGVPGLVTVAKLYFTVLPGAASGATFTTQTTGIEVSANTTANPNEVLNLSAQVRKKEATLTVGTGGGGTNQPPVAAPGGPYSGTVGTPISFNGAGSSDPDGSIVTYAWAFGDGATATGPTPSHAYATSAGSPFTVSLTVTDNLGASSTATTTATISEGGGGGNQSPIARPGGPYAGSTGAVITFDGSASSDPDGSIVSYAWNFGDGATGSGAVASHSYAAAGSYTATLTVTDNSGAQNSATASVTISDGGGGGGQPFTWSSSFGAVTNGQVTLTIMLDLSTDIPQTPGPEALAAWAVVRLKWDPAVLRFFALNIDSGSPGGFNFTNAPQGDISFSGSVTAQNSQGVIPIARVKFDVIGAPGATTTTQSTLGTLLGTPATGDFSYGSLTRVTEGTFTAP